MTDEANLAVNHTRTMRETLTVSALKSWLMVTSHMILHDTPLKGYCPSGQASSPQNWARERQEL